MTETLNITEARARFSELVQRARRGEEILISREGQVVARLVPAQGQGLSAPGLLKRWLPSEQAEALRRGLEAALPSAEQAAQEGEESDGLGRSLPRPRRG
ncbi:prevent-host-death family protein [Tistlia consotensis]|uniref:Antitoxin n=1 Tax=Tistlia consotensis USBA 355 TaxID=560819 RepID=A0A1Y6C7P2_9PROT|nr:type II toxin-antitoxin system prevent-host-death family antitoxin [Tistlia consotensis]SMF41159.1 prevent-host-death family protein [Tistlia consotensis USBA 355]SNR73988.1 prevent-host-death family protein [Tistlia consotensis]